MNARNWLVALATVTAFGMTALPVTAAPDHPPYFRILSTLNNASQLLNTSNVESAGVDVQQAQYEVQEAMADCHQAGLIPLTKAQQQAELHPTTGASDMPSADRLQQANRLLHQALTEVASVVDPTAQGAQIEAINHITSALTYTHQAMADSGIMLQNF